MAHDIEIRAEGGCVLITGQYGDTERRWWFDVTEKNRLVFAAEVRENEDGRVYMDRKEMKLPDELLDALEEDGYEGGIFDVSATRIVTVGEEE